MTHLIGIDPNVNYSLYQPTIHSGGYYNLDTFDKINSNEYQLKLLNINIRSFHRNSQGLEALLSSTNHAFNCIVLSESWNSANNYEQCTIQNFIGFHEFRKNNRGGGITALIDKNIYAKKIDFLSIINPAAEICTIQMDFHDCKILLICIYRPPTLSINDFLNFFEGFMCRVLSFWNGLIVLAGDMNIDTTCNNHPHVSQFISTMESAHFINVIKVPTRLNGSDNLTSGSLIDHIWVNANLAHLAGVIEYDLTDHSPSYLFMKKITNNSNKPELRKIETRPFSDSNLNSLKTKLKKLFGQRFYQIMTPIPLAPDLLI